MLAWQAQPRRQSARGCCCSPPRLAFSGSPRLVLGAQPPPYWLIAPGDEEGAASASVPRSALLALMQQCRVQGTPLGCKGTAGLTDDDQAPLYCQRIDAGLECVPCAQSGMQGRPDETAGQRQAGQGRRRGSAGRRSSGGSDSASSGDSHALVRHAYGHLLQQRALPPCLRPGVHPTRTRAHLPRFRTQHPLRWVPPASAPASDSRSYS